MVRLHRRDIHVAPEIARSAREGSGEQPSMVRLHRRDIHVAPEIARPRDFTHRT